MGYAWNALSYQEKVAEGGTTKVLGLSLIVVFLILAALYQSWSLPFSVLLSTPVAVLGAFLGLLARHFDSNIYAQIGLVMLVGLTAKNAILIVEFAKARLDEGTPPRRRRARGRAAAPASHPHDVVRLHLRVPAAVGRVGAARSGATRMLGTTVVTGMLAATALGIFLVPALFVFMERLAGNKGQAHAPAAEGAPGPAPKVVHE